MKFPDNKQLIIAALSVVVVVLASKNLQLKDEVSKLKDAIDFFNAPENEVVIVVNENLKSKQDRTRLKIDDLIATNHYPRMPFGQAENLARIVVKYSERYKVPVNLVLAVMTVESAFNQYAISPMGAMGLMQVMPSTSVDIARELKVTEFDLFGMDCSIRFGTYYLRKMIKTFNGDIELAVRAYNTGAFNVARSDKYPEETIAYHKSVMSIYRWLGEMR